MEEKRFYVYAHYCQKTNEIIYIGKGTNYRFKSKYRNLKYKNYVKKYGNPIIKILKDNMTEQDAFELEELCIRVIGRKDLNEGTLLNLSYGGGGASGYKHSKKAKRKISESLRDRVVSKETKNKISKSNTGSVCSDEKKRKISEANKGNNYRVGKKMSIKSKNKISKSKKGVSIKGKVVFDFSTGIYYKSLTEAYKYSKYNSISYPYLSAQLTNKKKNKTTLSYV